MRFRKSITTALILSLLQAPSPALAYSGKEDPLTLFEQAKIEFGEATESDKDYYNSFKGKDNPLSKYNRTISLDDFMESGTEVIAMVTEEIINDLRDNITDQTSLLEIFRDSHPIDCLKIFLRGICVYTVLRCSLFGCSISIEFFPQIEHYNPDFIVTSYGRTGASPVNEIDRLYDGIQTESSKAVLELISGEDVPVSYRQEHMFSGANTQQSNTNEEDNTRQSGTIFSEVEVIGHPGNLISISAKTLTGQLTNDATAVLEAQVGLLANIATQGVNQVNNVAAEVTGGGPNNIGGPVGNPGAWAGEPGLGDTSRWQDNLFEPVDAAIVNILGSVTGALGDINAAANSVNSGQLGDQAQEILSDPGTFLLDQIAGLDAYENIQLELDNIAEIGGLANETGQTLLAGEFNEANANAMIEGLQDASGLPGLDGDFGADIEESITQIQSSLDSGALSFEVAGQSFDLTGGLTLFCPSVTQPLMPYYLSGLNVLSWRMQLPEMVYPRSYALPFPDSELFLGNFSAGALASPPTSILPVTLPDWSTWSNIYPRSGWVLQNDELKARATAAFRGVHVVTREDQSHLYRPALNIGAPGIRTWFPEPLNPNDITTGAWQMVYPEKQEECSRLPETGIDPGINTPRDPDLTSDSGSYVWNVWRQYRCCQEPGGGAILARTVIPITIPIIP